MNRQGNGLRIALLLLPVALLAACSSGPRDIDYGKELCAHCSMAITDTRFAAELLTDKSKVYVFDAVECMAAFVNDAKVPEARVGSMWVMDHGHPGTFIDAAKAYYLQAEQIQSPMGMNLAAFATEDDWKAARQRLGGKLYRWLGLRLLIAKEWSE